MFKTARQKQQKYMTIIIIFFLFIEQQRNFIIKEQNLPMKKKQSITSMFTLIRWRRKRVAFRDTLYLKCYVCKHRKVNNLDWHLKQLQLKEIEQQVKINNLYQHFKQSQFNFFPKQFLIGTLVRQEMYKRLAILFKIKFLIKCKIFLQKRVYNTCWRKICICLICMPFFSNSECLVTECLVHCL